MNLRLVTLNTWGLPFPLATHPRWARFPRIARYLLAGRFDVIALQEVWSGAPKLPVPGLIQRRDDAPDSGLVLGGRHPLVELNSQTFRAACGLDRLKAKGWLSGVLRLAGGRVVEVVSTNLQAGRARRAARVRRAQLEQLLDWLVHRPFPTVLMGDLNLHGDCVEDAASAALLADAGLQDLVPACGGGTYVGSDDRLDRIYARSGEGVRPRARSVQVVRYHRAPRWVPFLSDHLPVEAELELCRTGRGY